MKTNKTKLRKLKMKRTKAKFCCVFFKNRRGSEGREMKIGSCEAEKWDITRDTCKFPHQSQEEGGDGKIW